MLFLCISDTNNSPSSGRKKHARLSRGRVTIAPAITDKDGDGFQLTGDWDSRTVSLERASRANEVIYRCTGYTLPQTGQENFRISYK